MPKRTRTNPYRLSLRLTNPTIKGDYQALAETSKAYSLNGLVEMAMEVALPHLRARIANLRKPIE